MVPVSACLPRPPPLIFVCGPSCSGDRCGGTGYHFDLDPTKFADIANFAADGGGIVFIKWRR